MRARFFLLLLCFALATGSLNAQAPPDVPDALRINGPLLAHLVGKGDQIYTCEQTGDTFAWKLKAPEATLSGEDGSPTGRHGAGPTWEFMDGSQIRGKVVASVPSPDAAAIPWLLLAVSSHGGSPGLLSRVESVQRLHTTGGKAPETGCQSGKQGLELRVPYQADYYFYGKGGN